MTHSIHLGSFSPLSLSHHRTHACDGSITGLGPSHHTRVSFFRGCVVASLLSRSLLSASLPTTYIYLYLSYATPAAHGRAHAAREAEPARRTPMAARHLSLSLSFSRLGMGSFRSRARAVRVIIRHYPAFIIFLFFARARFIASKWQCLFLLLFCLVRVCTSINIPRPLNY